MPSLHSNLKPPSFIASQTAAFATHQHNQLAMQPSHPRLAGGYSSLRNDPALEQYNGMHIPIPFPLLPNLTSPPHILSHPPSIPTYSTNTPPKTALNKNRWRYFRWTPRTAYLSFMYAVVVPSIGGYIFYRTDVSLLILRTPYSCGRGEERDEVERKE